MEMKKWPNWSNIIIKDDENRFLSAYVFHDRIVGTNYANDIIVIDDTSCTNYYKKPVIAAIVEDEKGYVQHLLYAITSHRTKAAFICYFNELKMQVGSVRVFICDRNEAQINAIKAVFPQSFIIYCHIHIGKNIKDKAGKEMFYYYQQMINEQLSEEMMLAKFNNYIIENPDSQGANLLITLISEKEHWLPSIIQNYMHLKNTTSNRVEGFFGSLKTLTDHKILTFGLLVKAMYVKGESLLMHSANEKKYELDSILMKKDDSAKVGNFAISIINEEYNNAKSQKISIKYGSNCCNVNKFFGLPCRHLIFERDQLGQYPLLSIYDIKSRWYHNEYFDTIDRQTPNTIVKKAKKNGKDD